MTDVDKHLWTRVFERLDEIESRLEGVTQAFKDTGLEYIPELTRCQMVIIAHLRRRSPGIVRSGSLMDIIDASGASYADGTTADALRVQVHRIREILKPFGIEIRNQYGVGYSISRESALALDRLSERLQS